MSSPQRAWEPPYCACCWTAHSGTLVPPVPPGTVTTIWVSDQLLMVAGRPPIVTLETAVQAPPTVVQRLPKP